MEKSPMKAKVTELPSVTTIEAKEWLAKSATVNMRVTEAQKAQIKKTAEALHLSITDYLIKCHELVSQKIKG
jgi:predicted DNA binding CopG/RHH family protein